MNELTLFKALHFFSKQQIFFETKKMLSLEEASIAAFRHNLTKANSSDLLEYWSKAIQLKGGNESGIFDEMACRDIIAYTILHFINLREDSVFGGFVRSHFSGKVWHDIDIFVSDEESRWMRCMTEFLCLVLCFKKHQISYHQHSPSPYSKTYDLRVVCSTPSSDFGKDRTIPLTLVIKLDLVHLNIKSRFETRYLKNRLPISIGSCLKWSRGVVSFRCAKAIQMRVSYWLVEDIIDLLKQGKDVRLCLRTMPNNPKHASDYREYYWYRITKMKRCWELLPADCHEPPSYAEEDLSQLMQRLTLAKVNRATVIVDE